MPAAIWQRAVDGDYTDDPLVNIQNAGQPERRNTSKQNLNTKPKPQKSSNGAQSNNRFISHNPNIDSTAHNTVFPNFQMEQYLYIDKDSLYYNLCGSFFHIT